MIARFLTWFSLFLASEGLIEERPAAWIVRLAAWLRAIAERRRGPWVTTRSGARWYPFSCRAEDLVLEDLGATAYINRWAGHAGLCTVAEHQVRTALLLQHWGESALVQLEGGMHDAAEALPPGDVAAPVLRGPWWLTFGLRWLKRRAECAVRERCGLPREMPLAVKAADEAQLVLEATARLPVPPTWAVGLLDRIDQHVPRNPARWEPEYAEWRWWCLVAYLAPRAADELHEAWSRTGEGWDRIVRLRELAAVAERQEERLRRARVA